MISSASTQWRLAKRPFKFKAVNILTHSLICHVVVGSVKTYFSFEEKMSSASVTLEARVARWFPCVVSQTYLKTKF
jgi:hypothetical protein